MDKDLEKPSCSYRKETTFNCNLSDRNTNSQVFLSSLDSNVSNDSDSAIPYQLERLEKSEFDKELDKINKLNPIMNHFDRVENWNVTKEDLMHGNPTEEYFYNMKTTKRCLDSTRLTVGRLNEHSSNCLEIDDSDSDSKSREKSYFKRNKLCESDDEEMFLGFQNNESSQDKKSLTELDFRETDLNPEIDKRSMIQIRKYYHKVVLNGKRIDCDEVYKKISSKIQAKKLHVIHRPENVKFNINNNVVKTNDKIHKRTHNKFLVKRKLSKTLKMKLRNGKMKLRNGKTFKETFEAVKRIKLNKYILPRRLKSLKKCIGQKSYNFKNGKSVEKFKLCRNQRISIDSALSTISSGYNHVKIKKEHPNEDSMVLDVDYDLSETVNQAYLFDETLILVQDKLKIISFYKYSKIATLFGITQKWELIGNQKISSFDEQIQPKNNSKISARSKSEPFYLDFRAKQIMTESKDSKPLASVYVNVYGIEKSTTQTVSNIRMRSVQLDTLKSRICDMCFTLIPESKDFMLSWRQATDISLATNSEMRTGLCKYSLTSDFDLCASIKMFQCVEHRISSIQCLQETKLIGLGQSNISIWDRNCGDLLYLIDLQMDLNNTIACFSHMNHMKKDNYLFLIQILEAKTPKKKSIGIISVDLANCCSRLIHNYEVDLNFQSCTGCSLLQSKILIATFDNKDILTISTNNFRIRSSSSKRLEKCKVFLSADCFLLLSKNQVDVRTVVEYLME